MTANDGVLPTPNADERAYFTREILEMALGTLDHRTQVWQDIGPADPIAAIDRMVATGAEVVVVGPEVGQDQALEIVRHFDERYPGMPVILMATRTELFLDQALRAGAAGFLDPIALDSEIRSTFNEARSRAQRRREHLSVSAPAQTNRVIPVLAAKGGAGKTMLATNLAAALAQEFPREVVLVDLDLQFGDVTSNLGIDPASTIIDAAAFGPQLDATTLKAYLAPALDDSLFVLAAPMTPAQADSLTSQNVATVLRLLAQEFRFVLIDTAAGIDETTLETLDIATDLVLLTSMDVPTVRATAKELDALRLLGMERVDWHLVLNRSDSKVGLAEADIEATLGRSFTARIPSTRSIPISVNQGQPLVIGDPRLPAARAMTAFAKHISGSDSRRGGFLKRKVAR